MRENPCNQYIYLQNIPQDMTCFKDFRADLTRFCKGRNVGVTLDHIKRQGKQIESTRPVLANGRKEQKVNQKFGQKRE
jgi:hypothetical protein